MKKKIFIYSLIFLGIAAIFGYFSPHQFLAADTWCPAPNYCRLGMSVPEGSSCPSNSTQYPSSGNPCVCEPGQTQPYGTGHCAGTATCGNTGQWTSFSCGSPWNYCEQ
ncbi:MAG: hypothetical protein NTX55_02580, partial [Candidatus Parcubacteria bacterium]|nr:hypothetical protein [Candidatus Parcubacteria bacterium]